MNDGPKSSINLGSTGQSKESSPLETVSCLPNQFDIDTHKAIRCEINAKGSKKTHSITVGTHALKSVHNKIIYMKKKILTAVGSSLTQITRG